MQTRVAPLLLIAFAALLGACSKSREITSLDRAEADARVAKARAEIQFNDIGKAESLLVEAVGFNPDAYPYWLELVNVRLHLGKKKEARKACEQAVAACQRIIGQEPGDINVRLDQIRLLVSLGNTKDAQKALDQAGRDLPHDNLIRDCIANKLVDKLAADPEFLKLPE